MEYLRYEEIKDGEVTIRKEDIPYDRVASKPLDLGEGSIRYHWVYKLGHHVQAILDVEKGNGELPGVGDPESAENVYFRESSPTRITLKIETRWDSLVDYPNKNRLTQKQRLSLESVFDRVQRWHFDQMRLRVNGSANEADKFEAEKATSIRRFVAWRGLLQDDQDARDELLAFFEKALTEGVCARYPEIGHAEFANGDSIDFVPGFDSSIKITPQENTTICSTAAKPAPKKKRKVNRKGGRKPTPATVAILKETKRLLTINKSVEGYNSSRAIDTARRTYEKEHGTGTAPGKPAIRRHLRKVKRK